MESNSQVKILDVCQVNPSTDSPESATGFTLPLSFLDIMWLKVPSTSWIFFYEVIQLTPDIFNSAILPNLKHSLSCTLLHFLPLAGNLSWPSSQGANDKPVIVYTPNDGVSLTIAESSADFYHFAGNDVRIINESHPYIPELCVTDSKAPLIAFQITLFPNQGFCVGITLHHVLFDGKTTSIVFNAWAHISRQCLKDDQTVQLQYYPPSNLLPNKLKPFFDRTVIKDSEGLDRLYLNNWFNLPGMDPNNKSLKLLMPDIPNSTTNLRVTVDFSRQDIKKLKEMALSQIEKDSKMMERMHLSSFVLTYAYILVCIVKARRVASDYRKVVCGFSADGRARLDPPLSDNYFGNVVIPYFTEADPETIAYDQRGFAYAIETLSELVVKVKEARGVDGMKEKLEEVMAIGAPGAFVVSVTWAPQFGIYDITDFGWGKPRKVEITSIDRSGSISMTESKDGRGGIEIGLILSKQELEVFNSLLVVDLN